MTLGPLEQNCF